MIIDTHCHLDDLRYQDDLDEVLGRAKEAGIASMIIPGADIADLKRAIALCEHYDHLWFAAGVHPYHHAVFDEPTLRDALSHPKCVAVGECGLDHYRLPEDKEERAHEKRRQKEVFIAQIALAREFKKPLIVHIRDASADAKEILLEYDAKEVGGVLHCFNADEQLLSLAKQGFYFGIGGVLTFKNAKKLVSVLPKIPLDRLLFETDAPYLTPEPFRGSRNEPAYTALVVAKAAELLDCDPSELAKRSTANALRLFGAIIQPPSTEE
ncbi:MAG: TatD family hydrolase [Campylobacterales bacterium]